MGMDLLPRRDIESFHANWTGWRMLRELLGDTGVGITAMAGSNDGDEVDAATATAWADAIESALASGSVIEVRVADARFADGWRVHLRTESGQVATPVLAVQLSPRDNPLAFVTDHAHTLGDAVYAKLRAGLADAPPADVEVGGLGDAHREFLISAVAFFRDSGGFAQY